MSPRSRAARALPPIVGRPPAGPPATALLTVLVLACGGSSQQTTPAPEPLQPPPDAFVHPFTGMTFPAELEGFLCIDIRTYDELGADTSVTYADPHGVHVTIYNYPVRAPQPDALRLEFEDAVQAIHLRFQGLTIDSIEEIAVGEAATPDDWGLAMFATGTLPGPPPQHVRTLLFLFRYGDWFLKYRASYPLEIGDVGLARVEQLIHALTWPGGALPPTPSDPTTPGMVTQRE